MRDFTMVKNIGELSHSLATQIQNMEATLQISQIILRESQKSFLEAKEEREKLRNELCELLAKNGNLRRKDFQNLMKDILDAPTQLETKIRDLLNDYFNEQQEMVHILRKNLEKLPDSTSQAAKKIIQNFQTLLSEVLTKQEEKKKEISNAFTTLQKEQEKLVSKLKELLAKGNALKTKDLKALLGEFEIERQKRITHKEERKEEVRKLLQKFQEERSARVKSSWVMQNPPADRGEERR